MTVINTARFGDDRLHALVSVVLKSFLSGVIDACDHFLGCHRRSAWNGTVPKRRLARKIPSRSTRRPCPSASLGGSSAWDEAWDKLSADEIQAWTSRGGPPTPLLVRTPFGISPRHVCECGPFFMIHFAACFMAL